jgi:biotin carboxyl carrier protein
MEIQVGDKIKEITLLSKEGNKIKVEIDGKVYNVDVAMLENGTCSLIHKGNSYNAQLIKEGTGKHYVVNLDYSTYQIDMLDSQAKYMRMRKGGAASAGVQADTITAPMPCKIVKVLVKEGDELKAGDAVLTTEAMKMQSNQKVTADCVVEKVMVSDGDNVAANQELVKLKIKK